MFKQESRKVDLGFEVIGLDGKVITHPGPEKVTTSMSASIIFGWQKLEKDYAEKISDGEPQDMIELVKEKLLLVYEDLDVEKFVNEVSSDVTVELMSFILDNVKLAKKKGKNLI